MIRKVAQVRLKGKAAKTLIFEVIEWKDKLQSIELGAYLKLFYAAHQKYFDGEFEEAHAGFQECFRFYSED
jgi:hypothetical protein